MKCLKSFLVGQFGPDAVQVLEAFGFEVVKAPGPKTTEKKAESRAKAKSTRERRKAALEAADRQAAPPSPAVK